MISFFSKLDGWALFSIANRTTLPWPIKPIQLKRVELAVATKEVNRNLDQMHNCG